MSQPSHIRNLVDFRVLSSDGHMVGRVERVLVDEIGDHLVVKTRRWIQSDRLLVACSQIATSFEADQTVLVDRTRRQLRDECQRSAEIEHQASLVLRPWVR